MTIILRIYNQALRVLNTLSPVMIFIVRVWIARVFWASGILAISDWNNTLYLFTNEFPVPLLPPLAAAVIATFFEIVCPVLLTIGLASRLATLPLLAITAVINFTYDNNPEHYYWAILLGSVLCFGPGKYSVDHWIKKKFAQ